MRPIPVLMYHHVNPHKGDTVTVTPDVFEGQMRHLREAGYRTLTIDELLSYIAGETVLKQRAVVVTFDDGWLDNFIYAFPVMKRYNINACIFIVTDWVKNSATDASLSWTVPSHKESKLLISKGFAGEVILGWDQIRAMQESGLAEFYAHTRSHARCDTLSNLELLSEVAESKQAIENHLGKPCPYLCWPYGEYNDAALKAAREAGYKALFTTVHGVVTPGSDPFAIRRIVIKDSIAWFEKRMLIYTNSLLAACYLKIKRK
ncbi:MAG: polysaccharide deacetylase family protein [Dissulfurispiraceae bacterium]